MRTLLLALVVILQITGFGQTSSPALQNVINTENNFAALSKEKNTREAFLAYLSDSTVLFRNATPVLGKESWINGKADSSLLFWWPVFAGISRDGDLAFSTGPWQWSPDRKENKPVGFGYYSTIWKKQADGTWKMGVDIGISLEAPEKKEPVLTRSAIPSRVIKKNSPAKAKEDLLNMSKSYIDQLNAQAVSLLPARFTSDALVLRNELGAYRLPDEIQSLSETAQKLHFIQLGGDLSSSQDLGYTYGSVEIETIQDDKKASKTKAFMHVWKREKDGWKIVLDVISRN
jgi:ketosteroid isomerase-like protein